jgi:hypothetical protein
MLGSIVKTFAYVKAPKKTLIARHPLRTASAVVGLKLLKHALPKGAGRKALGAAALLAIPVAAVVGRGSRSEAES